MSADIHICGSCLQEFHDLDQFITHKKTVCNPASKPLPLNGPGGSVVSVTGPISQQKGSGPAAISRQLLVPDTDQREVCASDCMLSVLSSPQKSALSLLSQHSTEQISVPSHQQLQLRQLLDAQKVNLAGIDMTKVIVLNPTSAKPATVDHCEQVTSIQLSAEQRTGNRQSVPVTVTDSGLLMTPVLSAPTSTVTSNMQTTMLTYDQLQKLVNSGNTSSVLQDIVMHHSVNQSISQPVNQPVTQTVRIVNAADVLGSQQGTLLASSGQVSLYIN